MKLRRMAALLGAVALTFSATSAVLATAPTGHEVAICHANSDEKDPYVKETVDIAQAGYGDQAGHSAHGGDGVWYPGAKADKFNWGDIIPPFDYGDFHYDGLNWTAAGQEIWNNACVFFVHEPGIHIEKHASETTLPAGGGSVSYSYDVTNTGNVPLSNVTVTDDKCSPVVFDGGDSNSNNLLDLTEMWGFTCSADLTETTTNTAVATGHDGDTEVTDDDQVTVTVEPPAPAPGISIDKTAAPLTIAAGDDVTYTYVVTNTGDTDLDPVTVSDDNGTPGDTGDDFTPDCPATKLAVGEHMTCTATVQGTQVTTTNIAVATGWVGEDSVSDNDDATVTVGGGGVEAETDTPTGPPTDALASTSTDAGGALPLLLLVLGVIGLGAVVLTPKRSRR